MKNTTTSFLLEALLQTLDVETFIKSVQEFDNVTQRQCFLKALKELRKPDIVVLHGQVHIKNAVQKIRDELDEKVVQTAD